MNEAIATKALENLRARVADLEAERNAARAETERLRAELATRTDERDDAMNGWKKADTEAEQARAALAKTQDHRAYLQERLRKSQKEAAGRKAHGERLRAELALWENTRPYVAWLRKAKAERDEARTEAGQLRAMYDDLCKSMSQTGDRLATAERERDEAREQLDGIETRVFQRFADGDVEGDDLNAMTVTQLTDYVMAAIRKGRALDGTEAGR